VEGDDRSGGAGEEIVAEHGERLAFRARHHSTVNGQEIREGIARVISLAKLQQAMTATPKSAPDGVGQDQSGMHGRRHRPEMKKAS
jgi:hypothetical protein